MQNYLQTIRLSLHDFRSHVGYCAKSGMLENNILVKLLGKAEISYFKDTVMEHNVLRFKIPVDNHARV
jgi:hypothetical protein